VISFENGERKTDFVVYREWQVGIAEGHDLPLASILADEDC
jgi:hypothetical protein